MSGRTSEVALKPIATSKPPCTCTPDRRDQCVDILPRALQGLGDLLISGENVPVEFAVCPFDFGRERLRAFDGGDEQGLSRLLLGVFRKVAANLCYGCRYRDPGSDVVDIYKSVDARGAFTDVDDRAIFMVRRWHPLVRPRPVVESCH